MKSGNSTHWIGWFFSIIFMVFSSGALNAGESDDIHTWEMKEIELKAENSYANFYTDVTCWVELKGPGFSKRVYGFWDGDNVYKVRVAATAPGKWEWVSGSNQPDDKGLNNQSGTFTTVEWTEEEKAANPNRHGFIRPTPNGHALQHADGTPFFMIGDTWLAATTWRLPYRNAPANPDYLPGPGIGFEDAVAYRKGQGFNSVSMIASYPNWESDCNPSTYADSNGIYLRNAWEKFDYLAADGNMTAKNMRDEYGNRPFKMSDKHPGVADFDRIIPAYFQSLDKKMQHLSDEGFTPLIETVRRDMCPSWKAYFDFNESYARYVQYLISRYGAFNILFSGIHLDWIPKEYSLTADEFNEALTYHLNKYGPLPFGQPHTVLINNSTYRQFGHDQDCPWLTMHSVGNKPRDHRVSDSLEILFRLDPPYPAINFEPYYTGWHHEINPPSREHPPANSERDLYFSRSQMYCSVLSGGLSGHVHGTSAYDFTTTGEPDGMRHHIWDALRFESANYMRHLKSFIMSEGARFQDLQLGSQNINPQRAPGSPLMGMDGWSFMMQTPEKDLAFLYFENLAVLPELSGFKENAAYTLQWYDPITGAWLEKIALKADKEGKIKLTSFPDGQNPAKRDWAAKIKQED
ncbi:MAG: DUF4038 domain-containing protein [Calditrichaceae bacterium]|nr:DUF4038 domain-containing protein [Calditrichaceae bacterium]MBN2707970.1 DUF4038 domain-containing protein [Calditrichaceae bacterium]RQV95929.1 MAG: DUF4038 domain-containing protein [Calditrichota bacterium]